MAGALRRHAQKEADQAGLTLYFFADDALRPLPKPIEDACTLLVEEALENVVRHAGASNLWIRLGLAQAALLVTVRDDGRGFDVDSVRRRAGAGASLGLIGMEERVALLGGSFELRSLPGHGTAMLASFPLGTAGRQRAA
jgi:signal transduction histidine kinase